MPREQAVTNKRRVRVHRWADLAHKASPERREEIRRWAKEESARLDIVDMNLRTLREALGKTQAELAAALDVSQPELSVSERREDHLVSTLRRYVEALGGTVEIVAHVAGKRIRLVV